MTQVLRLQYIIRTAINLQPTIIHGLPHSMYIKTAGEIIAPVDKSRSVTDPKILETFRTYFFTALLLWKILDYIYNIQLTFYMTYVTTWMSWDSKMIRVNRILFHPSLQKQRY